MMRLGQEPQKGHFWVSKFACKADRESSVSQWRKLVVDDGPAQREKVWSLGT